MTENGMPTEPPNPPTLLDLVGRRFSGTIGGRRMSSRIRRVLRKYFKDEEE